jgi:hypothetical protein
MGSPPWSTTSHEPLAIWATMEGMWARVNKSVNCTVLPSSRLANQALFIFVLYQSWSPQGLRCILCFLPLRGKEGEDCKKERSRQDKRRANKHFLKIGWRRRLDASRSCPAASDANPLE